jgi:hypothetical protein
MKKLLRVGLLCIMLLIPTFIWATDDTCVITPSVIGFQGQTQRVILTIKWKSDSGAGTVAARTINANTYGITGYYLISSETISTGTAPANGYVATVKTASGSVLFTMTGSNSTSVGVLTNYQYVYPVTGNLTFNLSGVTNTSATATCILVFTAN